MNQKYLYKFTVFTPTFNRAHLLYYVYNSLKEQTFKNFEWIIVDDGSTDNTRDIVNQWIKEGIIDIKYFWQKNSGKHVAINFGAEKARGELFLIIDSDDSCADKSLEIFDLYWNRIGLKERENISGIFTNCVDKKGNLIGSKFPKDFLVSSMVNVFYRDKVRGDKWGFFQTNILQEYKFPVFPGENFLTEAIVWNRIGLKYKTIFVNENLLLVNYQENGLSAGSLKLRIKNFRGATAYYKEFYNLPVPHILKIRNLINYIRFSLHGRIDFFNQLKDFNFSGKLWIFVLYPFGSAFFLKDKII